MDGQSEFVLRAGDIEGHNALVRDAGLKDWSFRNLCSVVMSQANAEGRLTLSAFSKAVTILLERAGGERSMEKVLRSRVNATLQTVYRLLDRASSSVDGRELCAALAIFCGGPKSEKLGECFSLFDSDQDQLLTRRQILLFLRSFLTALFSVSISTTPFDIPSARAKINKAVTASVCDIFKGSHDRSSAGQARVSFEDFAEWYNSGKGVERAPWLELLDPSKWPEAGSVRSVASVPAATSAVPPGVPSTSERKESAVLRFPLSEDGPVLTITSTTALWMSRVLQETRIALLEPEQIVNAVKGICGEDLTAPVNKKVFGRILKRIVRSAGTPKTRGAVEALRLLENMFWRFPKGYGKASARDVACALLLLASGGKSEKLATAFDVMDVERKDSLTPAQLYAFFRAFLVAIVSVITICQSPSSKLVERDLETIETGAIVSSSRVMSHCRKGRVQFSDLADWYRADTSSVAHWLELLDNRKWSRALRSSSQEGQQGPFVVEEASEDESDDAAARDTDMEEAVEEIANADGEEIVFSFPLPYSAVLSSEGAEAGDQMGSPSARPHAAQALCFRERDCIVAAAVSRGSGLNVLPPAEVFARFLSQAPSRRLSRTAYERAFKRLVRNRMTQEEQSVASVVFGHLWLACVGAEGEDDATADAVTVATAASVLTWGSKSSKLSLAFDYFDTEGEGFLSFAQLTSFVGSILRGILSLRADAWRVLGWVEEIAQDTAKAVFAFASRAREDAISFDEFAAWYNSMGVKIVPWIELLDMNKWPRPVVENLMKVAAVMLEKATEQDVAEGEDSESEEEELQSEGQRISVLVDKDSQAAFTIGSDQAAGLSRLAARVTDTLPPANAYEIAFELAQNSGSITMKTHLQLLRRLMPSLKMDPDDEDVLAAASIHAAVREEFSVNDTAPVVDLVTATLLLLPGSKSDKLAAAWNAYCTSASGNLSSLSLSRMLHAFLLGVYTLAGSWASGDDADTKALKGVAAGREEDALNEVSMKLTMEVLAWAGKEDEAAPSVSFEEFGEWYNEGGYGLAPWVELLDVKKWRIMTNTPEDEGEDVADDAVLDMPLVNDDTTVSKDIRMTFTENCIQELKTTVVLSDLYRASGEDVVNALIEAAQSSTLTREDFHEAVRALVNGGQLDKDARSFLSLVFTNMFYAYDRENSGEVDVSDLCAGFLLFCAGNKSEKLALAFQLFDEQSIGRLEKPSFWRFIRSFLTMLMWVIASEIQGDKDTIDIAAWEITRLVFSELEGSAARDDSISFEEFGAWYNAGGYSVIPWLELLNLARWPGLESELETSSKEVARFQLNDAGESVTITEDDRDRLQTLLEATQFARMNPDDVIMAFEKHASDGMLDKASFDRAIRSLVPGGKLSREEKAFLSFALSNIFYAFDRDGNGVVDLAEFLAGFTLLASGGKSDKLALAFRLFDEDGDGYISRDEIERYLRAFLTVLIALQDSARTAPMSELIGLVSSSATELTRKIFEDADTNQDGRISFEEFGAWYNRGGYEVIPWLELLNLKKWGMRVDSEPSVAPTPETATSSVDKEAASQPVFIFRGLPSIGSFEITAGAVNFARRLLRSTGLFSLTIESVAEAVASASKRGQISPEAFEEIVARILPASDSRKVSESDRKFRGRALVALFYAFDREGNGSVAARDLAAGLCMLASGRKSGKLNLAWQLFDEDTDGYLTLSQFQGFIASFLTTLVCIRDQAAEGDGGLASDVFIEKASLALAVNVFSAISGDDSSSRNAINFDEFGQWYNSGGFSSAPWLELLELRKWALARWAGGSNLDVQYDDEQIAQVGAQVIGESPKPVPKAPEMKRAASAGSEDLRADTVLISAPLPTEQDTGKSLNFHASDILRLHTLLISSGLSDHSVEDVIRVIPAYAEDGTFTLVSWYTAVQEIAQVEWANAATKRIFVDTITQIFDSMGGQATGAIDAAEATTALLMLVKGSKSEKLPPAFLACANSGNGENGSSVGATVESSYLGELGLWRFFRAMLVVLAVLSREKRDSVNNSKDVDVDTPAMLLMHEVMDAVGEQDSDGERRVSYSDFVDWYNRSGYSQMPWIELLDLNKWVLNEELLEAAATAVSTGGPREPAGELSDNEAAESDEAGVSEEDEGNLLFRFVISDRGDTIIVTRSDYEALRRLLAASNLGTLSTEQLYEVFEQHATNGALDITGFHRAVRQLIPGDSLRADDKAFLSIALSKVFNAFDRDGNGVVDFSEFLSGFSLLAQGGKSDKLSLAFSLFDEDGDGYISKAEMWRFLRSFLTILYTLSSHDYASNAQALITTAAVELTRIVFADADTNHDGRISFEEFGEWYNTGGYEVMPWLELLDIQKWHAKSAETPVPESQSEGAVIFQFPLTADSDATTLTITEGARESLLNLLSASGVQNHGLDLVEGVLSMAANESDGDISEDDYETVLGELLSLDELEPAAQNEVLESFTRIFAVYDLDNLGFVRLPEFFAGFSIFCKGSKSEKLSAAWSLFDDKGTGALSKSLLWRYLRSYLRMLLVLQEDLNSLSDASLAAATEVSNGVAWNLVHYIMEDAELETEGEIKFEEFGTWYNDGGYKMMSWLELLDISKWEKAQPISVAREEQNGLEATPDIPTDDVALHVPVLDNYDALLSYTEQDLERLRRILRVSGLNEYLPSELSNTILDHALEDGSLSKDGFDAAVRSLVPGTSLNKTEKRLLSVGLSLLYYGYEQENAGVSAVDLATGLSVLGNGTKSDKLSAAWRLFDDEGNGELDKESFWSYIRSFLTPLAMLQHTVAEAPLGWLTAVLDAAATNVTAQAFSSISGNTISYDQFGEWYNEGGYKAAAWLELLDLRKWALNEKLASDTEGSSAAAGGNIVPCD